MAGPGKPASVDNSWLNAARSCWLGLAKNGYTDQDLSRNLIHHLGAAFPGYGALTSNGADADLSMPITTVLAPDASQLEHSQTPVLNPRSGRRRHAAGGRHCTAYQRQRSARCPVLHPERCSAGFQQVEASASKVL